MYRDPCHHGVYSAQEAKPSAPSECQIVCPQHTGGKGIGEAGGIPIWKRRGWETHRSHFSRAHMNACWTVPVNETLEISDGYFSH